MTKIDLGQKRCKGFTLLELMYATTLGAIVSVAVGGMVANYWKTAQGFIQEEQTMQEIYMLSTLFRNDARALLSVTDIEVSPTKVEFGTKLVWAIPTAVNKDAIISNVFFIILF